MSINHQDGKASVPEWVRSLIVFIHGIALMDAIDAIGAKHDSRLKGGMGQHKANRMMIGEMASNLFVPAYITLIFWVMLSLYTALPDPIADLYWSMV